MLDTLLLEREPMSHYDNDSDIENMPVVPEPTPVGDKRHYKRRHEDISLTDAVGGIGSRVSSIRNLILFALMVGGLTVTTMIWLGWKQQSPADAINGLQTQLDQVRREGLQRDTLIHGVARSVALLTYYRCTDENDRTRKAAGTPLDCVKLLQDNER